MLVYKYRKGDDETFDRDLNSIKNNLFFAPKYDLLNDPCETLVCTDKFNQQTKAISFLLGKNKEEQISDVQKAVNELFHVKKKIFGIYSLSKIYNDELLWAHYSNSHKGFCIEYDLEKLLAYQKEFGMYSFDVEYYKNPPQYTIKDINKRGAEFTVKKIAGYKSLRWGYEKEYRIVTDFHGNTPYSFEAVKGIYFGVNMLETQKQKMIKTLRGRGIQFYQIQQVPKTYKFERIPINDLKKEEVNYFKVIPNSISNDGDVQIKILEKEYFRNMKGTIIIEIERVVNEKSITWLANKIKEELFQQSERLFVFIYLKNDINRKGAWATAHFSTNLDVKINGASKESVKELQEVKVSGEIVNVWEDLYSVNPSKCFLVIENGALYMKTLFAKTGNIAQSELAEELIKKQEGKSIRYDYQNHHGEYYLVEENGNLGFYGENGKFKESIQKL